MEYLNANYELITVSKEHPVCADWIEVPEGAEMLVYFKEYDNNNFYKSGFSEIWQNGCWDDDMSDYIEYCKKEGVVLWQRTPSVDFEDTVNHPTHYTSGSVECIEAIEASMSPEAFKGFLKGNVQKYMWRYEQKGGAESLEKAQWYLNLLLSRVRS